MPSPQATIDRFLGTFGLFQRPWRDYGSGTTDVDVDGHVALDSACVLKCDQPAGWISRSRAA